MPFNKTHVQYVLAQFDAGVSTPQILIQLESRFFLPRIKIAMIEQCLRDNGRLPNNQQVGNATHGTQPIKISYASNLLSPANQGAVGSSAATQRSGQIYTGSAMEYFATADDRFANTDLKIRWDSEADELAIAAHGAKRSEEEIWIMLRSRGYNVTRAEVVASLIRQRVHVAR